MKYKFHAYGHPNILGTHKTTLEFTKDKDVSLQGDCIIGVDSDFELGELKKFGAGKVEITISSDDDKIIEEVKAHINPDFNDNHELVIRKTDFVSSRTFGIKADKASVDLNRALIAYLKEKKGIVSVIIEKKD